MKDSRDDLIGKFEKIGLNNPNIKFTNQVQRAFPLTFSKQFDKSILNQISCLFYILFRIYNLWINSFIYKKVLNKQITSKTKLWYSALSEARNYGAIILNPDDRKWIDLITIRFGLTNSQKFLLVWSRCINYKKRAFGTNFQDNFFDKFFMLYLALSNWIALLLQSFLVLSDTYFLSIKFLFVLLFIYIFK
ncbi:hypothetical protein MTZ49_03820 [Entomomonas sp. E2T0]|uniref:hypothetical protein n=1 Tax=Entomomonas sp. E2T0 TaxID=2930213 RepID=UPI0022281DBD|nr:hypothetical protein [Entomomonas sp. E2T0]UYZ84701.1 hypothetical protein MTZ49_03820 [Entomomonas sp. E2T0]